MLDWQKEQVEQMKKLPDFDNISVVKNYDLGDDEDDFGDDEDSDNGQGDNSDADKNDDDADEKNDFNNFGDEKADDEKDTKQRWSRSKSDDNTKEKEENKGEATHHAKGGGDTNQNY